MRKRIYAKCFWTIELDFVTSWLTIYASFGIYTSLMHVCHLLVRAEIWILDKICELHIISSIRWWYAVWIPESGIFFIFFVVFGFCYSNSSWKTFVKCLSLIIIASVHRDLKALRFVRIFLRLSLEICLHNWNDVSHIENSWRKSYKTKKISFVKKAIHR